MAKEVKAERTGWRDLALSQRHRRWGWDCPAVDLDFLFLEYDKGKAVALVEYKNEHAPQQYRTHPTYQAMIDLANRAEIPCIGCRYAADFSWFRPVPLNSFAEIWLPQLRMMTERDWVTLLYNMRGYVPPDDLFKNSDFCV